MSNINALSTMQKKAIRTVALKNCNAHTEPIFKNLRILPLSKLILFFNLQIMQKFKQGFLPTSFNQTWSDNRVRRDDQFEISLRLSSSIKLPLVNLPKTWENFDNESIKIIRNKAEFNLKLKKHLLDELNDIVHCNLFFCPSFYHNV